MEMIASFYTTQKGFINCYFPTENKRLHVLVRMALAAPDFKLYLKASLKPKILA